MRWLDSIASENYIVTSITLQRYQEDTQLALILYNHAIVPVIFKQNWRNKTLIKLAIFGWRKKQSWFPFIAKSLNYNHHICSRLNGTNDCTNFLRESFINCPELFSVDFKVTIIKTCPILQTVFRWTTRLLNTRGNGAKRESLINGSLNIVFSLHHDKINISYFG